MATRSTANFESWWKEAEQSFLVMTEEKYSLRQRVTLESAILNLDRSLNSDDSETGARQQKIKSVATDVLQLFQLVGGIAAEAASTIFGPANMCFNALNVLLTIPAKLSRVHGDICTLLEKVASFLKQFKIYKRIEKIASLDNEFQETVHRLLITWVEICGLCYKYCHRDFWHRVKDAAKLTLFDNDSGVSAALQTFASLTEQHRDLRDAVELELVVRGHHEQSESMNNIWNRLNQRAEESSKEFQKLDQKLDLLVKDSNEVKAKEEKRNRIDKLSSQLGIPVLQDRRKDPLVQLGASALPGTGKWLDDHEYYREWSDLTNDQQRLLILKGDAGSGASFLMASILNRFENTQHQPIENTLRMNIISHIFENNDKADANTSRRAVSKGVMMPKLSPTITALRAMALRLAIDDEVYCRRLYTALNPSPDSSTTILNTREDILGRGTDVSSTFSGLFSATTMVSSGDTHYAILLDGVDRVPDDEAAALFQAIASNTVQRLKIVVSVTTDFDTNYMRRTIIVKDHNTQDIQRYVEYLITQDRLFQSNDDDTRRIIEKLTEETPQIANGSYYNAQMIFSAVRDAIDEMQDTDNILGLISEGTLATVDLACEKAIGELKNTLSVREIEQLNELLIWTIYGKRFFKPSVMRAILFLSMKKRMLQALEERIKHKFSPLLKIDEDGDILMKDWGMEDYFSKMPRLKQDTDDNNDMEEPRITLKISITNAKVSHVQRFMWDLNEKLLLDKVERFTFTDPVKDQELQARISANRTDSQLVILRRCFDLLLNRRREETQVLASYATGYTLNHIPPSGTNEDKAELTVTEKQNIVEWLVLFLMDPEYLEDHLTEDFFEDLHFLSSFENALDLLSDTVATAKLRRKEYEWVDCVKGSGMTTAVEGIAKKVAQQWLQNERWDPNLPYQWLWSYRSLVVDSGQSRRSEKSGAHDGEEVSNTSNTISNGSRSEGELLISEVQHGDSGNGVGSHTNSTGSNVEPMNTPMNLDADPQGAVMIDVSEQSKCAETHQIKTQPIGFTTSDILPLSELNTMPSDPIKTTLDWVIGKFGLDIKDVRFYKRLGFTYLHRLEHLAEYNDLDDMEPNIESGKAAFQSAKAISGPSWELSKGLAAICVLGKDFARAIVEADEALQHLRTIAKRTESEQEEFLQQLQLSSEWQVKLDQIDRATELLHELIRESPDTFNGECQLLKLFHDANMTSDAINLIENMSKDMHKGSETSQLVQLLLHICAETNPGDIFEMILAVTKDTPAFLLLLNALDIAHEHVGDGQTIDNLSDDGLALSLCHGIALACYDTSDGHLDLALPHLKNSIQAGFERLDFRRNRIAYQACECFFDSMIRDFIRNVDPNSTSNPVKEIETALRAACEAQHHGQAVRNMLASSYYLSDRHGEARRLMRKDVQCAIGLLSNDTTDDDWYGYSLLGVALYHAGDQLNAISALSLRGPLARHRIVESMETAGMDEDCSFHCDGNCEQAYSWTWSSSIWFCKICDDVQFCHPCIQKLCDGSLSRRVCSKDHEWFLQPSWQSEYEATGRDKVRAGGKLPPADGPLQNGTRIGGEIVPIEQWLNSICEEWNIARVTKSV